MKYLKKISFILLIITMLSSCGNKNVIFDECMVIPNASWNNQDFPYFDVNIEDTLSAYNFYLNIRHLENYKYSNFYMFLHTTFPNGNQTHDTIELVLAYPDGRWVGDGSGSMRNNKILLNNNLYFPLKGNYHFEIEQAMREPVLEGVTDVGVCFEKLPIAN
ncbi:MAG: gliding motility lipoprotein GldH [Bacteroidales bacterium]|nr:gliding motility lipoprotein GldH [Bacteroidales bacterium]MBQ5857329.1 gliding motility lipoprotein GldH [Bacteroidales bacterium]